MSKKLKKEALARKMAENVFQDFLNAKLEALRRSEENLAGIIASVTDHMSMIDEQYNIMWVNNIAKELFGPDLVGKKCYSAYRGYHKPCEPCVVSKCFEDGKVHEHETEVIRAGRNRMLFWCTCGVAERHSDGRPKLVMKISRDITECKHSKEQLQLSYDQAIIFAEELLGQIKERKQLEEALRERKAALRLSL